MNRRGFLGILAGAAAAVVVPELAKPKTIFLPPDCGWPAPRDALSDYMHGDFHAVDLRYKVIERYSAGWTDPRGVIGVSALPTIPPIPGYHLQWVAKSRLHEADLSGHTLAQSGYDWKPLRIRQPCLTDPHMDFEDTSCPQTRTGGCAIHGTACSNVNPLRSNYGHWTERQRGAWYRHKLETIMGIA